MEKKAIKKADERCGFPFTADRENDAGTRLVKNGEKTILERLHKISEIERIYFLRYIKIIVLGKRRLICRKVLFG